MVIKNLSIIEVNAVIMKLTKEIEELRKRIEVLEGVNNG